MKHIIITLAILAIGTVALGQARPTCARHDVMVAGLLARYGETLKVIGFGLAGSAMELFASEQTGTWTITITQPGGLTCMVAAGVGFKSIPAGEAL